MFGKIDDAHFETLMTQFDFTVTKTVCKNVTASEILIYRILGMEIFCVLSYLRSPSRILRLIKCLFSKTPFQPRILFEQRIYDVVARSKKMHAPSEVHAGDPILH